MKIKALKNLLKIGNWKLEITLLALLIFVFMPKAVDAALIIQAPKYIGLTNGLVGYWSFDGKDMRGNNRKSRLRGTFRNPNTTKILAHHLVPLYSFLKSMSIPPVDISRTMEVRGFAPRGFWMMSQFPCCTTPIAELS